jgi:hypothetical protein
MLTEITRVALFLLGCMLVQCKKELYKTSSWTAVEQNCLPAHIFLRKNMPYSFEFKSFHNTVKCKHTLKPNTITPCENV